MTNNKVHINDFFTSSKAYLVAISKYQSHGIPNLSSPARDVIALKEVLEKEHGFTVGGNGQPNPLLDPGKADLLAFFQSIKTTETERLIIYFAGHGIASDSDEDPEGFLIPADASPDDNESFCRMSQMMEIFTRLTCRHLLVVLDCCYAGSFRWCERTRAVQSRQVPRTIYFERFQQYASNKAWQVITSSAHDQKAIDILRLGKREDALTGLSPFAGKLVHALASGNADLSYGSTRADGIITATELSFYLGQEIFKDLYNAGIDAKERQIPMLFPLKKHDKGEFIFLNPAGKDKDGGITLRNKTNRNPYKGLESYSATDSKIFYGRRRVIEEGWITDKIRHISLKEAVQNFSLVIVTGPSGIGKSSLVKAGLPGTLDKYKIHEIRPGKTPWTTHQKFLADLQNDSGSILLVDQYEELITICISENERNEFENGLEKLLSQNRVIITVRSDFEVHLRNRGLIAAEEKPYSRYRFIVPPFTREEITEIVIQPALQEVLEFKSVSGTNDGNEKFINSIIDEAFQNPGSLPLLSFSLSELYEKKDGVNLLESEYLAFGGISGIIDKTATAAYTEFNSSGKHNGELFRFLLFRMISLEAGSIAKRKVYTKFNTGATNINELQFPSADDSQQIENIREALVNKRLLRTDTDENGNIYTEPAHDSLLSGWTLLIDWLKEKNEFSLKENEKIMLHRSVTDAAMASVAGADKKDSEGYLWKNDPRLNEVKNQLTPRLNSIEYNFISLSVKAKLRAKKRLITTAIVIGTIVLGLGIFGWIQAQRSAREASSNRALYLASESDKYSATDKLALLKEAYRLDPANKLLKDKIYAFINGYENYNPFPVASFNDTGEIKNISFSADSKNLIITGSHSASVLDVGNNTIIKATSENIALPAELNINTLLFQQPGKIPVTVMHKGEIVLSLTSNADASRNYVISSDDSLNYFRIYDNQGKMLRSENVSKAGEKEFDISPRKKWLLIRSPGFTVVKTLDGKPVDSFSITGEVISNVNESKLLFYDVEGEDRFMLRDLVLKKTISSPVTGLTRIDKMYMYVSGQLEDSNAVVIVENTSPEGPGAENSTIVNWNIAQQTISRIYSRATGIVYKNFSATGDHLLFSDQVDSTYFVDLHSLSVKTFYNRELTRSGFIDSSNFIFIEKAMPYGSFIEVFDEHTNKVQAVENSTSGLHLTLSPDKRLLAVSYMDNSVDIYEMRSFIQNNPYENELQTESARESFWVEKIQVSPSGNVILVRADVRGGEAVGTLVMLNGRLLNAPRILRINAAISNETMDTLLLYVEEWSGAESYLVFNSNGKLLDSLVNNEQMSGFLRRLTHNNFSFPVLNEEFYLGQTTPNNKLGSFSEILTAWDKRFYIRPVKCLVLSDTAITAFYPGGKFESKKIDRMAEEKFENLNDYFNLNEPELKSRKDSTWFVKLKQQSVESQLGYPMSLSNLEAERFTFQYADSGRQIIFQHSGGLIIAASDGSAIIQSIFTAVPPVMGKYYKNGRNIIFVTRDGAIHRWVTRRYFDENIENYYTPPLPQFLKERYDL